MNVKEYLSSLTPGSRRSLLIGIGLLLALTAGALWWAMKPRQQLLFGNLREADAAEIVQSLNEWKVPHDISDGGASIMVPSEAVYETRMRLVSAGVPRGGHVGFELFDDSDFGVTEFAQRVNYQRALQGEIERTIAALPGVETARVHLTIRKPGLFVGERETSKASVALTLHPGEVLTRSQLRGIRSLVASAVEGLSAESVSVLDSDGALLAGTATGAAGYDERNDEKTQVEDKIRARVTELLQQVLHNEEFRVSVDATLNFDAVHEVHELPSSLGPEAKAREEISRAPGRVEKLSIAVVLSPGIDDSEVARIRSLVAASAGVDSDRGDILEVTRLGRDEQWRTAPAPGAMAIADKNDRLAADAVPPTWHAALLWKWALIAVLGLLVGAIGAVAILHQPRALKPNEREAVLGKLRGWLAEGRLEP